MADPLYCPWIVGVPCLKPEVWAAWAQALLSVATIAITYWLATRQRRIEVADRAAAEALAARSFALVVLREMKRLKERVDEDLSSVPDQMQESEGVHVTPTAIPDALWKHARRAHLLGGASTHVLKALFQVQESREHHYGRTPLLWGNNRDKYVAHLQSSLDECDKAIAMLRAMLERD